MVATLIPVGLMVLRLEKPIWWFVALGVAVIGAIEAAGRGHRWTPVIAMGSTVALALVLGPGDGAKVAAITGGTGLVWALATGAVAASRTSGGLAVWPAVPIITAAGGAMVFGRSLVVPAGLVALAVLVATVGLVLPGPVTPIAAIVRDRLVGPATRAVKVAARTAGRLVLALVMAPAAVLMAVAWAIDRIVRHDRLSSPSGRDSTWVRRQGADQQPQRFHATVAFDDRRSVADRLSGTTAAVVMVALLVGAGLWAVDREPVVESAAPVVTAPRAGPAGVPRCADPEPDAVLAQQPDWQQTLCETDAVIRHATFYPPGLYRLADFEGESVNMTDGERRTWRPPACGCRRIKVWWFGGSAAWGYFQRDMHSLPSQLAKAAWTDGVALDITNLAMPGYLLGQEVRTFADLTTTEAPPDLVVFYDGVNDLMTQAVRATQGRVDDESEATLMETAFDDVLRNGLFEAKPYQEVEWSMAELPNDAAPGDAMRGAVIAEHAMNRYSRNTDLARRLADSVGAQAVFVWQPLLATSPPEASPPDTLHPDSLAFVESIARAARPLLPPETVDLTDIYEGVEAPVFRDTAHTNEPGAAVAAEALWPSLEPFVG